MVSLQVSGFRWLPRALRAVGAVAAVVGIQGAVLADCNPVNVNCKLGLPYLRGAYRYPNSNKIYAIYAGPYACWVINPAELDAINITQGWSGAAVTPAGTINFGSGSPNTLCAWPSGMFKPSDTNAVYVVYGATPSSKGTSCHVLNNDQVNNHGGWSRVWRPPYTEAQMNFKLVSKYIGDCPF